ncbi:alpha/beta hydrolase [Pengzhenrongella sicca]|uniref:Alpha/beta hydrolase n=1 Tax=Pengzhenrongella sicca TaxID=2819238 RepID=A0A8A4ZEJ9_9MICO|nr:alpha/beta hydrolase [Pengzhenrongella sicca]QTE28128.1 alpha/beta hydrolase [Pengzhenrongella sicca]
MTEASSDSTTVALVHGAFADAGSWAPVAELLLAAGVKVQALSVPLRGLHSDSTYVASAIAQVPGPVLAVGHSYGGAVITNAARSATNVVGLVYVNAFAPDENESLTDIEGTSRDSALGAAILPAQFPTGAGSATELYVNPGAFYEVFARDLPESHAAVLGASQRPIAASAFEEKSGAPAWKTLHSWAVVATGDKAAGTDVLLSMAQRAGAETLELDGSHLVMIAQPEAVADVILKALASVG